MRQQVAKTPTTGHSDAKLKALHLGVEAKPDGILPARSNSIEEVDE